MDDHEIKKKTGLHKTALVTGGSSGIGYSIVKKFSEEGIVTGFADINPPGEAPNNTHYFETDVTDGENIQALYENFQKKIGTPDVLVCNAGRGIHETLYEGDPELWIKVFELNVFGALRTIRAFLPDMLTNGFSDIIFVSSVSAKKPYEGGAIYAASKASLEVIAETLRLEVQPRIRVTTLYPGVVDTDFFKNIIHGSQTPESIGWGAIEPEEIADVIFYAITRPKEIALNNITIRPAAQPM